MQKPNQYNVNMAFQRKTKRRRAPTKFVKAIQVLKRMHPSQRCLAIRNSNDRFIRDVVSHVRKLRNKKLTPKMVKQVKRHSQNLRWIANPKISLKKKRNRLAQKGGLAFLPLLAPIIGAVAAPIINKVLGN